MGRRGAALSMKVVLPSVSWVAVMRLLKKAPRNLPSMGMGTDVVMKSMMGCRAMPETESFRYTEDYLAEMKGRQGGGGRRPKPAALLPMMSKISGCASRPHTDSFRVHHVVNQEALRVMLALDDDDDHEAFFETYDDDDDDDELICDGGINIGDGDRLLRDDHYEDCARAISSSSSRLSSTAACSSCGSSVLTAPSAPSRNSVDSEGHYSTATSTSCFHTPAELGHHMMRYSTSCSTSSLTSYTISSCCLQSSDKFSALELNFSDANSDHNLSMSKSEAWEFLQAEAGEDRAPELDVGCACNLDRIETQEETWDKSRRYGHLLNPAATGVVEGVRVSTWTAGGAGDEYVDECTGSEYERDDDNGGNMIAEVRYSEYPLEDFAEAIEQMVIWQQLNQPAQLHHLYRRYLRLNSPAQHPTITLAFLHALQHLASHDEPHLNKL